MNSNLQFEQMTMSLKKLFINLCRVEESEITFWTNWSFGQN